MSDVLFERNVIISCGAPLYHKTSGANTLASRSNLLWDVKQDPPVLYQRDGAEPMDLAQWQSIFGQDALSVVADPCFASWEKRDFRLLPASSAYALGFRPICERVSAPCEEETQ